MTDWWRRGSVHVAEALISEDREPSAAEGEHLGTCTRCFVDVRRGGTFNRQLGAAVATLSTPSIPPEVLTMAMPSIRRPSVPSATSVGVIAALVVAAALVTWTVLPQGGASARPSLAPPDPHVVAVDGAIWRVDLVGRTLEIHRSIDDPSAAAAAELLASWDLGEFVNGGAASLLRCPRPDGAWQWAVFGHQADLHPLTYSGPPAAWSWAPDGVWLVVLDTTKFDPAARVAMKEAADRVVSGVGGFVPQPSDIAQPSGCFISG
jgi:hypothetical protein